MSLASTYEAIQKMCEAWSETPSEAAQDPLCRKAAQVLFPTFSVGNNVNTMEPSDATMIVPTDRRYVGIEHESQCTSPLRTWKFTMPTWKARLGLVDDS